MGLLTRTTNALKDATEMLIAIRDSGDVIIDYEKLDNISHALAEAEQVVNRQYTKPPIGYHAE